MRPNKRVQPNNQKLDSSELNENNIPGTKRMTGEESWTKIKPVKLDPKLARAMKDNLGADVKEHKATELHEVRQINPSVFIGMDVVKVKPLLENKVFEIVTSETTCDHRQEPTRGGASGLTQVHLFTIVYGQEPIPSLLPQPERPFHGEDKKMIKLFLNDKSGLKRASFSSDLLAPFLILLVGQLRQLLLHLLRGRQ